MVQEAKARAAAANFMAVVYGMVDLENGVSD